MTFKEPEGQVARWLEELQAYVFGVEHQAGARHTILTAQNQRDWDNHLVLLLHRSAGIMHAVPSHAGKRAVYTCRASVWSTT